MADGEATGIARRELLKRGAVAGAIAWTAPVLLSVGNVAAAGTGQPGCCPNGATDGCGFSFISFNATCGGVVYKVKFGYGGSGWTATPECGNFSSGNCDKKKDDNDPNSQPWLDSSAQPCTGFTIAANPDGSAAVHFPQQNCVLGNWIVHQGQVCAYGTGGNTATNLDCYTVGVGNGFGVFPPAPNKFPGDEGDEKDKGPKDKSVTKENVVEDDTGLTDTATTDEPISSDDIQKSIDDIRQQIVDSENGDDKKDKKK